MSGEKSNDKTEAQNSVVSSELLAPSFFIGVVFLCVLAINFVAENSESSGRWVAKKINNLRFEISLPDKLECYTVFDRPVPITFVPSWSRNAITLPEVLLEVSQSRGTILLVKRTTLLKERTLFTIGFDCEGNDLTIRAELQPIDANIAQFPPKRTNAKLANVNTRDNARGNIGTPTCGKPKQRSWRIHASSANDSAHRPPESDK